jgi:AraC family transcriptional regulator
MEPRIEIIEDKKLIGNSLKMNLINDETHLLWSSFAPKIKSIQNKLNGDKISMQIYDPSYFIDFNPAKEFVKWATVEVADFNNVPEGIESFPLTGGAYAIFDYKGSSNDGSIYAYIFMTWLPNSIYELDNRPHFEVLGEKYKNNDSSSEEEIWIPIRKKGTF